MNDKSKAIEKKTVLLILFVLIGGLMVEGCGGGFFSATAPVPGLKPARMKLALIHFAAEHKKPRKNLAELLRLNREAADAGASLILNTEMAVSGYSFKSRQDIAPYTETDQGPTVRAISKLAAAHNVFIGIGFAERDPTTDIFYNTAVLIGPDGRRLAKYRKILTERRWARPGSPTQKGVADTLWGRLGMAVCADSYNGLIPRAMALKNVDLLWVPANWPVVGGLDPITIWRARGIENGYYLAVCNRTGKDLTLDCTAAVSCVIDPTGRTVFAGSHETSRIFLVELPLDATGHWAGGRRALRMKNRRLNYYRPIYLRPWMEDFTGFYKLPEPGTMQIHCLVPPNGGITLDGLGEQMEKQSDQGPALWVLPPIEGDAIGVDRLNDLAHRYQAAIAVRLTSAGNQTRWLLISPGGVSSFMETEDGATPASGFPFRILHFGPAALAMVPADAFFHPELAMALSKLGSDLVILSADTISEEGFLLSRVNSLAGMAVAVSTNNGAQITGVHDRHFNWEQKALSHSGVLSFTLDTTKTRKKIFHENIDYDILLAN